MTLRAGTPTDGLARSLAVIAATPAVEGVVLGAGALVGSARESAQAKLDALAADHRIRIYQWNVGLQEMVHSGVDVAVLEPSRENPMCRECEFNMAKAG